MKPDNPEVVAAIEELGRFLYRSKGETRRFTFLIPVGNICSYTIRTPGPVKSWITHSRRLHRTEWATSEAVVLSYGGKKNIRLNVVLKGSAQAYSLDVSLKTGQLVWRELNTKDAEQLKDALKVAQR